MEGAEADFGDVIVGPPTILPDGGTRGTGPNGENIILNIFLSRRFCAAMSFISAIKEASIPPNLARHL